MTEVFLVAPERREADQGRRQKEKQEEKKVMLLAKTVERWMQALTFSIFSLHSILGFYISFACCRRHAAFCYLKQARHELTACNLFPQLQVGGSMQPFSFNVTVARFYDTLQQTPQSLVSE